MTPSTPKPTRARGDAPADERTAGLTRRQRLVLETISEAVAARGYPPSMREIGDAVGLTSCLLYTSDAADDCSIVYISVVAGSLKK